MPAAATIAATVALILGVVPAASAHPVSDEAPLPPPTADWSAPTASASADPATLAADVAKREAASVVVVRADAGATGLQVDEHTTNGHDATVAAIAAAQQQPDVLAVGVDQRVRLSATAPRAAARGTATDPHRQRQWGMSLLAVESAWRLTKGQGAVVAIVDSGVDGNHPDLATGMTVGINTRADHGDRSPATVDGNGHGTHVAGIVAARAGNRLGVVGVAPQARIMPVKVLGADGTGWMSDVVEGITWAVDHGADVINLSLGAPSADFMAPAIHYALARGVTVVAAAGNEGSRQPSYPAAFPGVVSVSALDPSGRVAAYSNRGPTIDLVAPGTNIVSTVPRGYQLMSGTSMAAPHVAGVAALVESLAPSADTATILARSARDLGVRGRDERYGAGRVDVAAAQRLACSVASCPPAARAVRARPQSVRAVARLALRKATVLPIRTVQGVRVTAWRTRSRGVCRVLPRAGRRVVVAKRLGTCRLRANAPATEVLAPLDTTVRLRVTRH